jgi:hypothetical protein
MRRLAGFDIDGWSDLVCRNWRIEEGEERAEDCAIIPGGTASSIVVLEDGSGGQTLVGGPQAALAPQGRGNGWGHVGRPELRRSLARTLADSLESPACAADDLAASLEALAPRPAAGVLAIPDTGAWGDLRREPLLEAMRRARITRRMLAWRPVLACLGGCGSDMPDRTSLGVITHEPEGFGVQTLTLRRGAVTAPERSREGRLVQSALGYRGLAESALTALLEAAGSSPWAARPLGASGLAERIALGEPPERTLVRLDNGDWLELEPPAFDPAVAMPALPAEALSGCGKLVLETKAIGIVADRVQSAVERALGRAVERLPPTAVADGALVAARRLSERQPVYYDFLPRIRTIVTGPSGPEDADLVPPEALLPAGEEYRSETPAEFGLRPGQNRIDIWLDREGSPHPKRASVEVPAPAERRETVLLSLAQTPAAGRARLTLAAESWPARVDLRWEEAEEDPRDWEAIKQSIRPRPGIPDRLVLPSSLYPWQRRGGLGELLRRDGFMRRPDWRALARLLRSKQRDPRGRFPTGYALDSDGGFPTGLGQALRRRMQTLLEKLGEDVDRAVAGGEPPADGALNVATWCFRSCPRRIVPNVVEAVARLDAAPAHPLHGHGRKRLLLQGLGRIAWTRGEVRDAFDALFMTDTAKWGVDHVAAAFFLLSRTDHGPAVLSEDRAHRLAIRICELIEGDLDERPELLERGGLSIFNYGPGLVAGLLRQRLIDPYVLVAGQSRDADRMLVAIERVQGSIDPGRRSSLPRLRKLHAELGEIRRLLEGAEAEGAGDLLLRLINPDEPECDAGPYCDDD